jgi:hypothetical protein
MNDLTPSQKGAAAEAAITAAAIQLGLVVLRPMCEGRRCDLAIDLEPRAAAGAMPACSTPRGCAVCASDNLQAYARRTRQDEVHREPDRCCRRLLAQLHRSFLMPIPEVAGRRGIHLRLDPTKNNQAEGIKWARDYELSGDPSAPGAAT